MTVSSQQYPYTYAYDANGYVLRPASGFLNKIPNTDIALQEWAIMFGGDPGGRDGSNSFLTKDFPWVRDNYSHDQIINGQFQFPSGISFGDMLQDAGTAVCKVIKAVAPFIAMIPGVGTLIGAGLYAIGSIGAGDRIDQVAIDTIKTALPADIKDYFQQAVDIGYGVARGQRIDKISIELTRKALAQKSGPQAVAAFDAGLSIGTGKGLQDAGFKVLGAWANGATVDDRAVSFIADTTIAAAKGVPLKDYLYTEAQKQFFATVPAVQRAIVLKKAIDYFLAHPTEVVDADTADLANRLDIPIDAIRGALVCIQQMSDGSITVSGSSIADFQGNSPATTAPKPYIASIGEQSEGTGDSARAANDALAVQGRAIQASDYSAYALRNNFQAWGNQKVIDDDWRRGYDIGTAVTYGKSVDGPNQQKVRATLHNISKANGYDSAQVYQYRKTLNMNTVSSLGRGVVSAAEAAQQADYARQGAAIAASSPVLTAGRAGIIDGPSRRGFDIGCFMALGNTLNGPIKDAMRAKLGPFYGGTVGAMTAFDTACSLQYGITKSGGILHPDPQVAAGQAVITGVAGSGLSADQKAGAVATVTSASTKAASGAAAALPTVQKGLFARFLAFFGLA